jgi:hypothetical protein
MTPAVRALDVVYVPSGKPAKASLAFMLWEKTWPKHSASVCEISLRARDREDAGVAGDQGGGSALQAHP